MFDTQVSGSVATVVLDVRLTHASKQAFKDATLPLLENPAVKVVRLDLSAVNYLDSSAIGFFLLYRERCDLMKIKIALVQPTDAVLAILKMVRFDQIFEIEE
jgi:anti-anti-sigma factor